MVLFEQLRISDDGLQMYINARVNKADYFENIYIESVTIMTADKVSETAPELYTDDFVYQQVIEGEEKTAIKLLIESLPILSIPSISLVLSAIPITIVPPSALANAEITGAISVGFTFEDFLSNNLFSGCSTM